MSDDRLIVALDVHTMQDVERLVKTLGNTVTYYKVGMELFYSVGPDVVQWLKEQGKHVFLDLKLHDIPNTVAGGLASLMGLGADIVNVHASGGYTMMKTAAQSAAVKLNGGGGACAHQRDALPGDAPFQRSALLKVGDKLLQAVTVEPAAGHVLAAAGREPGCSASRRPHTR